MQSIPSTLAASKQTWQSLYESAKYDEINEKQARALKTYLECLKLARSSGADREYIAQIMTRIARIYVLTGKLKEAEPYRKEILAIACDTINRGTHHGELLVSIDDLIDAYRQLVSRNQDVEICLNNIIALSDRPFSGRHRELLTRTRELSCVYIQQGRFHEAQPHVKRAVQLTKGEFRKGTWSTLDLLMIAHSYRGKGKNSEAKELESEVKKVIEQDKSIADPEITIELQKARVYRNAEDYATSEQMILSCIKRLTAKYGAVSPHLLAVYQQLAEVYSTSNRPSKAAACMEKVLAIYQAKPDKDTWPLSTAMETYSGYLQRMGKKAEAQKWLNRSREMRTKMYLQ